MTDLSRKFMRKQQEFNAFENIKTAILKNTKEKNVIFLGCAAFSWFSRVLIFRMIQLIQKVGWIKFSASCDLNAVHNNN